MVDTARVQIGEDRLGVRRRSGYPVIEVAGNKKMRPGLEDGDIVQCLVMCVSRKESLALAIAVRCSRRGLYELAAVELLRVLENCYRMTGVSGCFRNVGTGRRRCLRSPDTILSQFLFLFSRFHS